MHDASLCQIILQAKDKGRDYFEDFQRNFTQSMTKIRNSRAIGLFRIVMTGLNVLSNAVAITARKLASHIVENLIGLNKPMSIQGKAATTELLFSFYEKSFDDCRKILRDVLLTDLPDRPNI
jgi:hypothetical protein